MGDVVKATFAKGVVLGAVVSSVTLVASVAFAGSGIGGVFNLGRTNTVDATTNLSGATDGPQLRVANAGKGTDAAGVKIITTAGKPPLVVNSPTKVTNLNADKLDGLDQAAFQRKLTGTCNDGTAIATVAANGAATCNTSTVIPISMTPDAGASSSKFVFPSQLLVFAYCHFDVTFVEFGNWGSGGATLNWMFSEGGTTSSVNASGDVMGSFGTIKFFYAWPQRLEGQWIFSSSTHVVTVNLHAFDGGSSCEIRGTAQVAAVA